MKAIKITLLLYCFILSSVSSGAQNTEYGIDDALMAEAQIVAQKLRDVMKEGDIHTFVTMHHKPTSDDPRYEENTTPMTMHYLRTIMGPANVYTVRDFFLNHENIGIHVMGTDPSRSFNPVLPGLLQVEVIFYDEDTHNPTPPDYKFTYAEDDVYHLSTEATYMYYTDGKWGLSATSFNYIDRHWPD